MNSEFEIRYSKFVFPPTFLAVTSADSIRCPTFGDVMAKKRIGLIFGMEDTFPWALIEAINARAGDRVEAGPRKSPI